MPKQLRNSLDTIEPEEDITIPMPSLVSRTIADAPNSEEPVEQGRQTPKPRFVPQTQEEIQAIINRADSSAIDELADELPQEPRRRKVTFMVAEYLDELLVAHIARQRARGKKLTREKVAEDMYRKYFGVE